MNKKILLTNFEISHFSGSEINIALIAKRFKELGYITYIASLNFSEPLFSRVKNYFDYTINLLNYNFDFSSCVFDIVWCQHSFILDWLIFEKKLKAKRIVNSCLSPFETLECAPMYANNLNLILANSEETKKQLLTEKVKKVFLFENSSPKNFFENNIEIKSLKKIAIVSNHVPAEVTETMNIFKNNNFEITLYGLAGNQELLDKNILEKYDCVISIGKTVQYCMALKIPIYIYDRFGGPGFLTANNLEIARKYNFSGRGFYKKTSEEIFSDILSQFNKNKYFLNYLQKYAYKNFCFENNLNIILDKLFSTPKINLEKIKKQFSHYSKNLLVGKKIIENIMFKEFNERKKLCDFYEEKILELKTIVEQLNT